MIKYEVVSASPIEVGLLKNGKGVRTWWLSEFDNQMPSINHPEIQKSIKIDRTQTKVTADHE